MSWKRPALYFVEQVFFVIRKPPASRGFKRAYSIAMGLEKRPPFDYNKIAATNCKNNQKEVITKWMTYIVYHIRSEIASTTLYLPQNIVERCSTKQSQILRQLCNWNTSFPSFSWKQTSGTLYSVSFVMPANSREQPAQRHWYGVPVQTS